MDLRGSRCKVVAWLHRLRIGNTEASHEYGNERSVSIKGRGIY